MPTIQVQVREFAPPGGIFERDAFAGSIGRNVPLTKDAVEVGRAKVIAAEVADDRRSVVLTLELDT